MLLVLAPHASQIPWEGWRDSGWILCMQRELCSRRGIPSGWNFHFYQWKQGSSLFGGSFYLISHCCWQQTQLWEMVKEKMVRVCILGIIARTFIDTHDLLGLPILTQMRFCIQSLTKSVTNLSVQWWVWMWVWRFGKV